MTVGAEAVPALPRGFRCAGVHCGIKSDPGAEDLVLVASDRGATAAGVYTQCRVPAAPVVLDRGRTPGTGFRAIVANSGNANACTGARGDDDAATMAADAAALLGAPPESALVLSTGIIGVYLPMDRVRAGIRAAGARLGDDVAAAARGLMTTDTHPKTTGRTAGDATITGLAKGAAMIAPNMGTMLAVLLTDAALAPDAAQAMLARAVDASFNCISVDGHTSTNDSVVLLANGAAGAPADPAAFERALTDACTDLARMIPGDGEGATHLVTVTIHGASTTDDARRVARAVAESTLVKTAVTGADPNWGRIVSAAGNAGVPFDPGSVTLTLDGVVLYAQGTPVEFDEEAVSAAMRAAREVTIDLVLGAGSGTARFWSCNLTTEYVRLNSEYTT